jgi:phenylacetate-CoA ligase
MALRIAQNHYWADHQRQSRDLRGTLISIVGRIGAHDGELKSVEPHPWLYPGALLQREVTQFTGQQHARWLCSQSPSYLSTLPSALSQIIGVIATEGLQPPPMLQILSAFQTTTPELRSRAREIFGASIRDRYSCEEIGPLAFQCPHSDDHYHVAVANAIVEVVDDSGNPCPHGVQGNVLVTGLHQWASPVLRYAIGDIASAHPQCPECGASVPALSKLLGRKAFLLRSPSKGLQYLPALGEHWMACAPVIQHRVVQTSASQLRAEVVLDRPLRSEEHTALLVMLLREFGEEFSIEVKQVPSIAQTSFKQQDFVREIP